MTTTGPDATNLNTCANCFAEFEWTPFVQDGEEFCCSGCADGGPCICTYTGAPHLQQESAVSSTVPAGAPSDEEAAEEQVDDESDLPAATAGDGEPPEPPEEPPAPSTPEGDEEPPTNGRLAIIMAAVSEMPLPVQEVVQSRLSNPGSDEEIGESLGLTGDEVRSLIEQGQAILDRTIGSTFTIRYIGIDDTADETPEPKFPDFDEVEDDEDAAFEVPPEEPLTSDPAALGQLISRSFGTLVDTSASDAFQDPDSRNVLSETLREVGNLLRLASERLTSGEQPDVPLRDALADRRGADDPITLIVENQPDIAPFFISLQAFESVEWAKLQSQTPERAEFSLLIGSMMRFVSDLMNTEGRLRPTRLRISGDEITVELPAEEPTEIGEEPAATGMNGVHGGPRFEMSVDSFFGARHFIESQAGASSPHHHSYRVEATFVTTEPDRQGFAVGFANVRELVDTTVMHYSETLLNTEDPFKDVPPTTENLARIFHQQIVSRLAELNVPSVVLERVRVWESPTSSASYSNPAAAGEEPDAAVAS